MVTSLNGGKPEGPNAILDPRSMAELTDDLKGELVGIGAQIDYDETTGMALLMGTLPGSAAAGAGLQKGDRVLAGRRATVPGPTLKEVMRAIRGKAGTSVRVSLLRGSTVIEKTMVRKRLALPSVEHMIAGDVALVTLRLFNERTPAELEAALKAVADARHSACCWTCGTTPAACSRRRSSRRSCWCPGGRRSCAPWGARAS